MEEPGADGNSDLRLSIQQQMSGAAHYAGGIERNGGSDAPAGARYIVVSYARVQGPKDGLQRSDL